MRLTFLFLLKFWPLQNLSNNAFFTATALRLRKNSIKATALGHNAKSKAQTCSTSSSTGHADSKSLGPYDLDTHYRGCYQFKNAKEYSSRQVLYRAANGKFSVKDCAAQCEADVSMASYAILSEAGDICECVEDLSTDSSSYHIGSKKDCDSKCIPDQSECGSYDGEFKSVYWWSRCTKPGHEKQSAALNRCKCAHGKPNVGAKCLEDHAHSCESCAVGYTLDGETCHANRCECPHGDAFSGEQCPKDGDVNCKECFPGYHLNTTGGGAVPSGSDIPSAVTFLAQVNGGRKNHWFFAKNQDRKNATLPIAMLPQQTCEINVCQCPGGAGNTPATGEDCPTHNTVKCSNCTEPGFFMNKMRHVCEKKKCVCDLTTGVAATGVDCPAPFAHVCKSCNPGYHLDGNVCEKNVCNCPHGKHAEGADCEQDGMLKCMECEEGFDKLPDGTCGPKVCHCPAHGDPAIGAACPANNTAACGVCDYHFQLNPDTKLCDTFSPKYLGCFEDDDNRDLPVLMAPTVHNGNDRMPATPESCDLWCHNYKYFAVQGGHECWCGNEMPARKKPDADCKRCEHKEALGSMKTAENLYCGGGWRNSVYEHELGADVQYVGCYEDKGDRAMLPFFADKPYTRDMCLEKCLHETSADSAFGSASLYFAIQNGAECACGDGYDRYGVKPDNDCKTTQCAAGLGGRRDRSSCGGGWRNSVYRYVGNTYDRGESGSARTASYKSVDGVSYHFGTNYGKTGQCPSGSNLATVETPKQMRFIYQLMGNVQHGVVLGYTDAVNDGEWVSSTTCHATFCPRETRSLCAASETTEERDEKACACSFVLANKYFFFSRSAFFQVFLCAEVKVDAFVTHDEHCTCKVLQM
ncbi:unnamed protein product [Amoebophrya sp. A120]|nr:unnamed protein product [Amoebophrya sp. A120]|eukprot:GSA120T00003860001.1